MKFIHLSDLHLVAPGKLLHGLDPVQELERCVASIRAHHADAALCVVTGDLTHDGEPAAYDAVRRCLARLPMPVHLMIGNHDDRAAFRAAFPRAPVDSAGFVQQAFGTDAGRFVLLDTHEPRRADGALCRRRLDWLDAELRVDLAAPLLLFLHHPPFCVGLQRMDRIRLWDRGPLLDTLRPYLPRVRHLFIGHLHRTIAGSWHGIPFSGVRGTSHQIALDFDTADVAPVSFEAPGYGVVALSPEAVVVHFEELAAHAGT